jgi:transposase
LLRALPRCRSRRASPRRKLEARIKELVEKLSDLAALVEPLLIVRRVLREQIVILHRRLLAVVRDDEVCRRLMTIPVVSAPWWR